MKEQAKQNATQNQFTLDIDGDTQVFRRIAPSFSGPVEFAGVSMEAGDVDKLKSLVSG